MGDKQRKLKDKASRLYSDGKLKEALKLYERVVTEDASELQCVLKMGDIYRKLGERTAAVGAYEQVAKHYAEDGMLLKAIAVCKLILNTDSRHTNTQNMLAELYSKRRGPAARPSFPPAAANAIELPVVEEELQVTRTSAQHDGPKIVAGAPVTPGPDTAPLTAPAWPPTAPGSEPPANLAWPVSSSSTSEANTPVEGVASAWPTTGQAKAPEPALEPGDSIEDSILDITVGEMIAPPVPARPGSDERVIAGRVAALEDEPIDLPDEPDEDDASEEGSVEMTWRGTIRIEDLDGPVPEDAATTAARAEFDDEVSADSAPAEAEPAEEPIPLTKRATSDVGDGVSLGLDRPQIPLFSDLPKNAFIDLLVKMEMREMEAGEKVIEEGQDGDSFFVIASGKVRVSRMGESGQEVTLAYLGDGAFFGEMALLQDGARTATVTVEEESQIFEISKDVLDHVVTAYPSVASVLRNFYKQRLLSTAMATHPLFQTFNTEERRGLMEMFKSKSFSAGDTLVKQGKKGSGLFLLLHGKLKVERTREAGATVLLAELQPGDMFGEMSLIMNQPTNASIAAIVDSFVVRLSKRKFDEVIMTHPQVLELVAQVSDERKSVNDFLLGKKPMVPSEGTILV